MGTSGVAGLLELGRSGIHVAEYLRVLTGGTGRFPDEPTLLVVCAGILNEHQIGLLQARLSKPD